MELRRQLTGALAWAGLVLIIAVPSAEFVRAKFFSKGTASVTTDVAETPAMTTPAKTKPKPATVASVPVAPQPALKTIVVPATTIAAAPAEGNAVKDYLSANKKLPDYITGSTSTKPVASTAPMQPLPAAVPAPATAVATIAPVPADVVPVAVPSSAIAPGSVANVDIQPVIPDVPPIPMPASARPKPAAVVTPTVTEADLKDWKSGTLEDYLKAHGLLADSAVNTDSTANPSPGY